MAEQTISTFITSFDPKFDDPAFVAECVAEAWEDATEPLWERLEFLSWRSPGADVEKARQLRAQLDQYLAHREAVGPVAHVEGESGHEWSGWRPA